MRKVFYCAIIIASTLDCLHAANAWVVAPSGGNYSAINSAVNSNTVLSGDTIYIKNSPVGASAQGNTLFSENVTIPAGKSLEIMPYNEDTVFSCQGSWTITVQTAGTMTVDIAGMNNTGGLSSATAVISVSGAGPSAADRCIVRLLGGALGSGLTTATSGFINCNYNYTDLTVYGMNIYNSTNNATIAFRHGSIIGDSIVCASSGTASAGIAVTAETTATTDTCYIVGNIIHLTESVGGYYQNSGIYWNSNTLFFQMSNNLVYSNDDGIYIGQTIASAISTNNIYNCTVVWNSPNNTSYTVYAIYVNPSTSGLTTELMNNCVARNTAVGATISSNYGIYVASAGAIDLMYNYVDKTFSNIVTPAGNTTQINNTVNQGPFVLGAGPAVVTTASYPPLTTSLGYPTTSAFGINGGNPGGVYSNIDKTLNTAGAYGGSYTLYNFFPLNTGSGRVWMTNFQADGTLGGTGINIKATSFDR